jgi:hypothetical protein
MVNSRDIFALGGECQPAGGDPPAPLRCTPTDNNNLSWEQLNRDNASAPNVAGQFGCQGGGVQFDLQGGGNTFSLGGGVSPSGPPANITQQWGDGGDGDAAMPAGPPPTGAYVYKTPPQQARPPPPEGPYSGMAAPINKWGIGDAKMQVQELRWQQGAGGNKAKLGQFRDVNRALQEFKTYLFVKPGSAFCTVVHSPMKFMAIMEATQQLQGRFIGFVRDRTLSKEPTPILLLL